MTIRPYGLIRSRREDETYNARENRAEKDDNLYLRS
jgi:hypothetical protein